MLSHAFPRCSSEICLQMTPEFIQTNHVLHVLKIESCRCVSRTLSILTRDCRKSFDWFVNVIEKKLFCGVCLFVLGMANTGRDVPEHTCEDTCYHQFRFSSKEINEWRKKESFLNCFSTLSFPLSSVADEHPVLMSLFHHAPLQLQNTDWSWNRLMIALAYWEQKTEWNENLHLILPISSSIF